MQLTVSPGGPRSTRPRTDATILRTCLTIALAVATLGQVLDHLALFMAGYLAAWLFVVGALGRLLTQSRSNP